MGSGLWAGQPRVQITAEIRYSFLQNVQIGSGPHPVSYSIDTGGCFPTGKLGRHGICYSPQSNAQVKMSGGAEPPHLQYIQLHSTCRENVLNFTAVALMVNKIFIKIPSLYFPL